MKEELIFHLVPEKEWKSSQQEGKYKPDILEEEGFIPCASGSQVQEKANQKYQGTTDLLMLVIDPTRVNTRVEYEYDETMEQKEPRIFGPINIDAVIDKIELEANKLGRFEIEVESN